MLRDLALVKLPIDLALGQLFPQRRDAGDRHVRAIQDKHRELLQGFQFLESFVGYAVVEQPQRGKILQRREGFEPRICHPGAAQIKVGEFFETGQVFQVRIRDTREIECQRIQVRE